LSSVAIKTRAYSLIPKDKYRNTKLEKALEEADMYPSAVLINFGMRIKSYSTLLMLSTGYMSFTLQ